MRCSDPRGAAGRSCAARRPPPARSLNRSRLIITTGDWSSEATRRWICSGVGSILIGGLPPGCGMQRQDHRRPRLLVEVEVLGEVAEAARVLADARSGVGASV